MAQNASSSSSSSSSSFSSFSSSRLMKEKPVIVRVKRKLNQTRFDGFWLEINERPSKRTLLDFSKLSISDSTTEKIKEEQKSKKLFVQLVETTTQSGAIESVLHSFLSGLSDSKETKIEARRKTFKQRKNPDESRQVARQKHEELARSARFEQIWRSRKGNKDSIEESLREICHLYDVLQVDPTEEKLPKTEKQRLSTIEDAAILCNYLPLLREYIPSAAQEIESDVLSHISSEENYVYDLYTVETDGDAKIADMTDSYPLVQVADNDGDDDYYDGPDKSDYETDDSNAEDNPLYDYPDEDSDEDEEEKDEFDDFEEEDYEREIVDFDDEDEREEEDRWRFGHY